MSKINRVEAVMDGLERAAVVPARHTAERRPAALRATMFKLADLAAVAMAWLGAPAVLHAAALPNLTEAFAPTGLAAALWLVSAVCVVLWLGSRRHHDFRLAWNTQLSDVLAGSAVAIAGTVVLGALARLSGYNAVSQAPKSEVISPAWIALWLSAWMIFVPALIVTRTLARALLRSAGLWALRTVIVAPQAIAEKVEAALRSNPRLGFDVIGSLDPTDPRDTTRLRLLDTAQADLLIVAAGLEGPGSVQETLLDPKLARLPIATTLVHPGVSSLNHRHRAFAGHDVVLLPSTDRTSTPVGGLRKQVMDRCGAAILLIVLAPLFILLAVLIRRDGGMALFRHQRLGANGKTFHCMKFRSMVVNSDRVLETLLANDPSAAAEWRATQKLKRDPRVTKVGQFLRKSSLDELPQLLNVLRGEMSLVGPRPIVRAEIVRYGSEIRYYFQARPGLTGLWQVSGRSDTSYAQRVELDVRYVANWTFRRDLVIVLKTIPAVVLRKGAV